MPGNTTRDHHCTPHKPLRPSALCCKDSNSVWGVWFCILKPHELRKGILPDSSVKGVSQHYFLS